MCKPCLHRRPFEGGLRVGLGGREGAARLDPLVPHSQSAPARAQVQHWWHEQLRLPDTSRPEQLLQQKAHMLVSVAVATPA
eukprot:scaffold111155_cov30-Phaeocystis_antarctica.AAC.2